MTEEQKSLAHDARHALWKFRIAYADDVGANALMDEIDRLRAELDAFYRAAREASARLSAKAEA
jgi:hypothetical protein